METLTINVPENPSKYFLEFSSKEEYLKKRQEWREIYRYNSVITRYNKRVEKQFIKAKFKIYRRMNKKNWYFYWSGMTRETYQPGLAEYKERLEKATKNIPKPLYTVINPTEFLKIRKQMKIESSKQRELSFGLRV
jgi:hypothetical protein